MPDRSVQFDTPNQETIKVSIAGDWSIHEGLESLQPFQDFIQQYSGAKVLNINAQQVGESDSSLVSYVFKLVNEAQARQLAINYEQVPEGLMRLTKLATSVPSRVTKADEEKAPDMFERTGHKLVNAYELFIDFVTFMGETFISFKKLFRGKAIYRKADLRYFITDSGPSSLGIVTLISVLMGMIIAFVGAVYMVDFGVEIYVVNIIGLAMGREMAPMMTAIIMAGRTGAAFAAQLGSMQVNEETDALKTMGIEPTDYLVMPRAISLTLMMPLLTIYANLVGILGGLLVCIVQLDMTAFVFFEQLFNGISFRHFTIGLVKSVFFGLIVALSGCYMGMKSGRSATAVGEATTKAVVLGIVLIVVFDAIGTIITINLDM